MRTRLIAAGSLLALAAAATAAPDRAARGSSKGDEKGATSKPGVLSDLERNFEMLSLWLESPYFGGCEWIFVHEPLKKLLVAHGHELAKKSPRAAEAIEKHAAELEHLLR